MEAKIDGFAGTVAQDAPERVYNLPNIVPNDPRSPIDPTDPGKSLSHQASPPTWQAREAREETREEWHGERGGEREEDGNARPEPRPYPNPPKPFSQAKCLKEELAKSESESAAGPQRKADMGRVGPLLQGLKQCNAKSKTTGEKCKCPAVIGCDKCRHHGGKSLRGMASKRYKHGKYSKYMPQNYLKRYEKALSDEELLTLRDEVAVWNMRIGDLLGRLSTGESGSLWSELGKTFDSVQSAISAGDINRVTTGMIALGDIIRKGNGNEATWKDLEEASNHMKNLVVAESKREVDLQQTMTSAQANSMMVELVQTFMEHIVDPRIRSVIYRKLQAMMHVQVIDQIEDHTNDEEKD